MNRSAAALAASLLAAVAIVLPGRAAAEETSPPASEWRGYCQGYLQALDGTKGNDLDVTYCLGITKGLLNGLRIGSQIGALSFGSQLAIHYKLDPDEVFKLFQTQDPAELMGVCAPPQAPAADYVRAVMSHLERNPKDLQRPIGEVFFEGLQKAWPCE
jgi:hypothetical protein